jgi:hypothetical protein
VSGFKSRSGHHFKEEPEVARVSNQMKMLEERLEHVRREIEKLRANEAMLRDMIREVAGEPKVKPRAPRSNVKQTVLALLEDAGPSGLNAASAVERAACNGTSLERGTVSSLLSRLKSEGVVVYDGKVYRLKEHSEDGKSSVVHPIRTSGIGR